MTTKPIEGIYSEDPIDWTHPVDNIEPEQEPLSEYREAASLFMGILYPALSHILATSRIDVGLAQVKYALDLADVSMTDTAAELGVTPQCISSGARSFINENNLPIPRCMESEQSVKAHRKGRINHITGKK